MGRVHFKEGLLLGFSKLSLFKSYSVDWLNAKMISAFTYSSQSWNIKLVKSQPVRFYEMLISLTGLLALNNLVDAKNRHYISCLSTNEKTHRNLILPSEYDWSYASPRLSIKICTTVIFFVRTFKCLFLDLWHEGDNAEFSTSWDETDFSEA